MKLIYLPVLAILPLAWLAGCQTHPGQDEFPTGNDAIPETGTRQANQIMTAQMAAGARHDAMLFEHHFNGSALNSLGEQKLTLMSQMGDSGFPLVVYMAVPQDNLAANRKDAVVRFLHDQGFLDSQLDIHYGENPNATTAAGPNLAALSAMNSGGATGSGTAGYGAPGSSNGPTSNGPGSAPALSGPGNFTGDGTK